MREPVAKWVQRRLAVKQVSPPSTNLGVRFREADTTEHVIVSQGDKLEFISGTDRTGYSVTTISPKVALRLAWFILWRWWIRGLWFGLKLATWNWTIEVVTEEAALRKSARIQRAKYAKIERGQ